MNCENCERLEKRIADLENRPVVLARGSWQQAAELLITIAQKSEAQSVARKDAVELLYQNGWGGGRSGVPSTGDDRIVYLAAHYEPRLTVERAAYRLSTPEEIELKKTAKLLKGRKAS